MQHYSADKAEQNLATLLIGFHKTDKFDLFGYLKGNKCEFLTILRKHKHKNNTIEEFIKGSCNFQCFHRHNFVFLSEVDWKKKQWQVDSVKQGNVSNSRDDTVRMQSRQSGIKHFNVALERLKTVVNYSLGEKLNGKAVFITLKHVVLKR